MPTSPLLYSVEESEDLSSDMLPSSLLVIHDTSTGRQNNVTELTRWKELDDPFLEIRQLHVEARADATSLVQAEHN
jgi:hypothetical protein